MDGTSQPRPWVRSRSLGYAEGRQRMVHGGVLKLAIASGSGSVGRESSRELLSTTPPITACAVEVGRATRERKIEQTVPKGMQRCRTPPFPLFCWSWGNGGVRLPLILQAAHRKEDGFQGQGRRERQHAAADAGTSREGGVAGSGILTGPPRGPRSRHAV